MKALKKLISMFTASAILAVGSIGVLPEEGIGGFAFSVRAADIVDSGKCGANLTWTLDSEGTLTISGEGEMHPYDLMNSSQRNVPWFEYSDRITKAVINEGVSNICGSQFYNHKNLISISIPSSINVIGSAAFQFCEKLSSIEIPNGVTAIQNYTFSGCSSITSIILPDTIHSIGYKAFIGCEILNEITIPSQVAEIGEYAFSDCYRLQSISIPDGVHRIETATFNYCFGLSFIMLSSSITYIGSSAFGGCDLSDIYYSGTEEQWSTIEVVDWSNNSLKSATLHYNYNSSETDIIDSGTCGADGDNLTWTLDDEGTLTISGEGKMKDWNSENTSPWYYNNEIRNVIIENGVTSIGSQAFHFYDCYNLTSITIPDSVTSIGSSAFENCRGLSSIKIPDSVTSIGDKAFYDCYSLTSITIPDSVISIGSEAFYSCDNLASITIPDSVTSIGDCAFAFCGLTSITIPDSVTSIGMEMFSCSSLTSITIPDSVTSIGDQAFYDCYDLTSITIPDSVTSIGELAFYDCQSLISIDVDPNNKNYASENGVLFNKNKTLLIQYPGGKDSQKYVIPDSVTNIGSWAFSSYSQKLTSIMIPDSMTSIGNNAFDSCYSLTSITIPDSITSIGEGAFSDCENLSDIYYLGTEDEWHNITIDSGNDRLYDSDVTIYFNSKMPDSEKQSVYQFFNMPLVWNEAKEYCESLNGHLAVISSAEEQAIIEAQIPNISKNCYWIGAYLENDEWKWVTDEPFEYENWGENLPDNYRDIEEYAHIYAKDNTNESPARLKGEWNDSGYIDKTTPSYNFYSNHNFGFICEWEDESLVPDNSEIDSKIYGYLDILERNPFYFGSTDTIEILHEYKEMARADPEVETYHFWKNLSNSIDGDFNEDEYNKKMTVEAVIAEIFFNEQLNAAFNKNAEQAALEAQNVFLRLLVDNAEELGIGKDLLGQIETILSTPEFLADSGKIAMILGKINSTKVTDIFSKISKVSDKLDSLGTALGFFQICYKGVNEGIESVEQLYNLYIACVVYHTSNVQFRQAVTYMSDSIRNEITKYTGDDDFSKRMRNVGNLYLEYYAVMLDESMTAYNNFASSITSDVLLGTRRELIVFSIKTIAKNIFPGLAAAEFVLDFGVSIWEAVSEVNERSLERDKLLNMVLFYDSFSNALYSENGFYGMLKETPTEESYKTLVIGIKMHTIAENMLIEYAVKYSHMLRRALDEWKEPFDLVSQMDYVKPVFSARYPQVNVHGVFVTKCWRTLDQDMRDDDIELLKLKKIYIDNDEFDGVKNICNLSETEAQKLGKNYLDYCFLSQNLALYSIMCPVNITIRNGDEIVATIENDVITYDNGEVFVNVYKEDEYENAYKYIILPEGYSLEITGYADGEMTFGKAVLENETINAISYIEDIPVTAGSVYREVIEENKTIALECDLDNDGTIDQIIDAILLGDVNSDGKLSISDAVLLARIVGEDTESTEEYAIDHCDVDSNDLITILDVIALLKIIAK